MTVLVSKSYITKRALVLPVVRTVVLVFLANALNAAQPDSGERGWEARGRASIKGQTGVEKRGHKFRIQREKVEASLARISSPGRNAETELWLPMPDGGLECFRIHSTTVMAPELAARYPEIRTYEGTAKDVPTQRVRLDVGPAGIHAQVLGRSGRVYVDPMDNSSTEYLSYFASDAFRTDEDFDCITDDTAVVASAEAVYSSAPSIEVMRTYRLAVAATGEYTQFHGGTVEAGLGAIVTAVNRLNGIYESELSIHFVLVGANDAVIYTNPSTDPYSNTDAVAMLTQNQANLDSVIGSANYDIGHVFGTGGGGIAQMASVCVYGWKGRGVTGRAVPVGDSFYVDYFAHEVGHQFSAHHTFNGVAGSCSGSNRHAATAYEPGSGSTIMSYSGICGSDNLQYGSDAYFHSASLMEIKNFIAGTSATPVSTGNNPPTVNAGTDFVIPAGTPFTLSATGSDPDGHALSYCWEQLDLGPASSLGSGDTGSGPLFRSFPPTSTTCRSFPRLENVLFNIHDAAEVVPTTSRTLHFRVTARDQYSEGGAFGMDEMQVTINSNAGPFVVLSPNSVVELSGNHTVQWSVAGTDLSPISAGAVNILLSTNGGYDFPIVLAANTPNDGEELVALPEIYTSRARIKVESVGNIFFDISDLDFTVVPQTNSSVVLVTETNSFTVSTAVLIPGSGTKGNASEFPLSIQVNGLQGTVEEATVWLHGLSHSYVDDLDILLVGPEGQSVMLLSDSGAGAVANNLELGFSDQGEAFPSNGTLINGVYQPSNIGATGDAFPVTAPYGNELSAFQDTDPNGQWNLYIVDDSTGDSGSLSGGWTLNLRTKRLIQQTNEAPVILTPSVQYVHVGSTLVVTNQAMDPDSSGSLTFALRPGAPEGLVVDEAGVLTWSPNLSYIGTTNYCTLSVADSGTPSMTSEASIELVVVPGPVMHPLQIEAGMATITWDSIPGASYQIEGTAALASGVWEPIGQVVLADGFGAQLTLPAESTGNHFFRVRVN